jgi:DMSO/TMAO reductase YedYZ molybdopterin-dependent catalytic subunit
MQEVSVPGLENHGKDASVAHPAEDRTTSVPDKEGLIVRSPEFIDLETPVEYFNTWLTLEQHFFVRNHMHEPSISAAWSLSVSGEVEHPYVLTLAELLEMETHSVVNTLECAGNGRAYHIPKAPGAQWRKGAVGTARFCGPRLRAILERAGVKRGGKHVMFRGLDDGAGKVPPFLRSIPIEKAMHGDTLVATHMNGAVLGRHHGFPARSLVPGWIGAASCKWITEIKVLTEECDGIFMSQEYRISDQAVQPGEEVRPESTHAITALPVKSLITTPADGVTAQTGTIRIQGVAWAGEADVVRVEVSVDGGASWQDAQLGSDYARYAWRQWSFEWEIPRDGEFVITARATDQLGRTQSSTPAWNPNGYLNNAVERVRITVRD